MPGADEQMADFVRNGAPEQDSRIGACPRSGREHAICEDGREYAGAFGVREIVARARHAR